MMVHDCSKGAATGELQAYDAALKSIYGQLKVDKRASRPECVWSLDIQRCGPVILSHLLCDAELQARITEDATQRSERQMALMCVERGAIDYYDGSRDVKCGVNSVFLMNVGRRFEVAQCGPVEVFSVTIPTHLLSVHCANIEQLCGLPVQSSSGLALILRNTAKAIAGEADVIGLDELRVIPALFSDLVEGVFVTDRLHFRDKTLLSAYGERIKELIEENIQAPELSPAMIADHLGVSKSYVFSIARKLGLSVSNMILERRLDYCREVLADKSWEKRSITEIAFMWGFKELSHFTHRFSARFGCSPKAYRASVLKRGVASS